MKTTPGLSPLQATSIIRQQSMASPRIRPPGIHAIRAWSACQTWPEQQIHSGAQQPWENARHLGICRCSGDSVWFGDMEWYMMIHDDIWWYMMIDDDFWWYMMIHDDTWWWHDNTWWYMMIHDDMGYWLSTSWGPHGRSLNFRAGS